MTRALTTSVPKYQVVRQFLLERIEEGVFPVGEKILTEGELMAALGISKGPIRQAVEQLVQEGRLRKIQGKGTFVCQPPKAVTPERRRDAICLFVPSLVNYGHAYIEELVHGVNDEALSLGVPVDIILQPRGASAVTPSQLETIESHVARAQGALSIRQHPLPELQAILRAKTPFFSIHHEYEQLGVNVDHIRRPYADFCARAAHLLVERGHRRTLFLDYRRGRRDAIEEFIKVMERAGGTADLMVEANGFRLMDRLRALVQRADRPSAVFASRYDLSKMLIEIAEAGQLNFPDDIAAIGYAEMELPGPLTLIVPPLYETGRLAVRRVLGMSATIDALEARLLDRGSVDKLD